MGSSDSARSEEPCFGRRHYAVLATVSSSYPPLSADPYITHPSAARQPRKQAFSCYRFRLACLLGLLPAFSLSHDQTLQLKVFDAQRNRKLSLFII